MNDLKNEWDSAAEKIDYDPMRPIRYGMSLRYIRDLDKNIKVLEIGCGEGTGLCILHKCGFNNLTGVEVSTERIRRASTKIPSGTQLIEIDPDSALPFGNNSFDLVISVGVIEHTISPGRFTKEIARVLRDNGYAIISSDCLTWNYMQLLGLYKSVQPIDKAMPIAMFKRIFSENSFKLIHFDTFHLPERRYPLFGIIWCLVVTILLKRNGYKSNDDFTGAINKAIEVSQGSINYTEIYYLKKYMLNYIDDENIFFIKKII